MKIIDSAIAFMLQQQAQSETEIAQNAAMLRAVEGIPNIPADKLEHARIVSGFGAAQAELELAGHQVVIAELRAETPAGLAFAEKLEAVAELSRKHAAFHEEHKDDNEDGPLENSDGNLPPYLQ